MKPTRRSQPFRRGMGAPPGPVNAAMKRGRTLFGQNPMDGQRAAVRGRRRRRGLRVR